MRRLALILCGIGVILLTRYALGQTDTLVKLAEKRDFIGVKSLLDHGADPNAPDDSELHGWTALMAAAHVGDVAIAKILIQAHANLNAVNVYGATALDVAMANSHPEVASIIRVAGGEGRATPLQKSESSASVASKTKTQPSRHTAAPLSPPSSPSPGNDSEVEAVSRIRREIEEPLIRSRLPGLQCIEEVSPLFQKYFPVPAIVEGQKIIITLKQNNTTLVKGSWSTDFPATVDVKLGEGSAQPSFVPAKVSGEELLTKLLRLTAFTQEDLAELATSTSADVRIGAASNLKDQKVLAKLATTDGDVGVRKAATKNLTDQATLAYLATKDRDLDVRRAAVKNLSDQALLTKLATADADLAIRRAAKENFTDQAILANLILDDKDLDSFG